MPAGWTSDLLKLFPRAKIDEPMSLHTTFRIGGPADAYVEISRREELPELFRFARGRGVAVFPLGWGSNLLVRDGGIRGVVMRLRGEFEEIEFRELVAWAGAGVRLPALVAACAEHGLAGTETLVGVPGTVGGALVMNAGTREGEIGDIVLSADVFDPEALRPERLRRERLEFRYRESNLGGRIVLGGELQLKRGVKVDILKRVRELQRKRSETQPIHTYNVGSTFKNPSGRFVAKLIEDAGLKGMRRGDAVVSEKHANFFENVGRASAEDVLALVEAVRGQIRERFGVELELEMKVVGE